MASLARASDTALQILRRLFLVKHAMVILASRDLQLCAHHGKQICHRVPYPEETAHPRTFSRTQTALLPYEAQSSQNREKMDLFELRKSQERSDQPME